MSLAIGVDVGGTKVAAGVVDSGGRILAKLTRSTPAARPRRTEQAIADVVTELLASYQVTAIGLGAAGFVDGGRSTMLFAPNLAWRDEPLKQRVEERLGRAVLVENDANASAWAEARFGAARGYQDAMLVAVGTGIGAALIIAGELYRGRWGIAGEPGHVRVVPEGRLCGCGNRGCWEQYASGNALVAEAREFARRTPGARAACSSSAAGPQRAYQARRSPRRRPKATRPRCAASRPWAAGWARGWPTWPRSSTRPAS